MILPAVAFVAAAVVLVTIIARGADHPTRPRCSTWAALARLHAEKIALLLVGVSAGWMILSIIVGLSPPGEAVALVTGTALWMLTHPAGWFAYVIKGSRRGCEELRPDP